MLILAVTIPPVLAEHDDDDYDDDKYEERDHDEDRESIFDEMQERMRGESEDDERHDDDDRTSVGGFSGVILYGTVIAVIATIGYTAFKILKKKK